MSSGPEGQDEGWRDGPTRGDGAPRVAFLLLQEKLRAHVRALKDRRDQLLGRQVAAEEEGLGLLVSGHPLPRLPTTAVETSRSVGNCPLQGDLLGEQWLDAATVLGWVRPGSP